MKNMPFSYEIQVRLPPPLPLVPSWLGVPSWKPTTILDILYQTGRRCYVQRFMLQESCIFLLQSSTYNKLFAIVFSSLYFILVASPLPPISHLIWVLRCLLSNPYPPGTGIQNTVRIIHYLMQEAIVHTRYMFSYLTAICACNYTLHHSTYE